MSAQGWLQIVLFFVVLTALTPLLGGYMAKVYRGDRVFLSPLVAPIERLLYRLFGVDPARQQDWKGFARSAIVFSAVSFGFLYVILRTQSIQPFNPQSFHSMPWDVSFNTAASFVTNTNWQYYGGEASLSNFAQMAGLAVQNFLSAAVGMAVLAAVIRGFAARGGKELGNFYADTIRTTLYILVPISIVAALVLISQGVVQTLSANIGLTTLAGNDQTLGLGPVASQAAIKQLGTNGGGFFNVNSAFPFENPTGFSNFVEVLLILLIPASLTSTFGRMVGNRRQGWALFGAMAVMLAASIAVTYVGESNTSPAQDAAGLEAQASPSNGTTGGNLEGKEQRFGIADSAEWAGVTTAASNGSVNSALDSYTGLGITGPMINVLTGEVIFGGVGSGLYGMLLMAILAVFIAGLMVGRTPEYLGKKIEPREMKLVAIGTLFVPLVVLIGATLAISTDYGRVSIYNHGPQGFAETLYAYTSQANNNGSALAGYTGFVQPNAPGNVGAYGISFADLIGGVSMLFGRFVPMIAALAVAGALAVKRPIPPGPGTFRTDTPTFVFLLIFVTIVVAALAFFPALLLGPVVQALSGGLF